MVDVRSDSNLFDVPPSALHLPSLIEVCLGLEVEGIERLLLSQHGLHLRWGVGVVTVQHG